MPSFARPQRSSPRMSRPPTRDSSVLGHGDVEDNESDDPEDAEIRSGEIKPLQNMTPRARRTSRTSIASASTIAAAPIPRYRDVPPVPPLPRMRKSSLGASIKSAVPPRGAPPAAAARPARGTR